MKKVSSIFSICLIIFVIFGNFSSPVLAYEKGNINFEQIKARATLNSGGTTLSKISTSSQLIKSPSFASPVAQEQKILLEKFQQMKDKADYVAGEILVKYKNFKINLETASGRATALTFTNSKSLENKEDLRKNNISVLKIRDNKTVEDKIAELNNDPNVEYAQPNYQYYTKVINTNDTHRGLLWGLDNTGQSVNGVSGINDADIDTPEAWTINEGSSSSVIVAVIDSGVAYNHPDLLANMWDGTNCKDENGAALSGCNHGYDYEDIDKTPLPNTSSHGTHIAGTISAVKNNSTGIIGVAPQAKIMAIKSSLTTSDNVKSINFAKQNSAKIINASWAGENFDQVLSDAISSFPGLFIAAAGNGGEDGIGDNNENVHLYPSDYNLNNIISVTATDQNDSLPSFSNYGATSVDVGAPGTNIYSTISQETSVLFESFETIIPPAVPSGWVKSGTNNNWGTYTLDDGSFWGNVLYGDLAYPYANNVNTTITSPTYNLSSGGANIDFWTKCDTEYVTDSWADYMALEFSSDGGNNFNEILKWDEAMIDSNTDPSGGAMYHFIGGISDQYLTSNFKLRFRWVTNSSDNNYDGCLVDDIKITKYSNGSDGGYDYYDGTSMATPHVSGLAALIEGYNPNLTTSQVKNIILTTGENKAALSGKTVSGKRINAYNALLASNPAKAITTFTVPSQAGTTTINEIAHTIALTVPFGTVVTALVPTIVITGASVSPASGVANNFTNPATYTVTAADGSTQAYIVTVTIAPATSYTISGTIKYYDDIKTVSSTTVILEDNIGTQIATTTTNASGTYQFMGVTSGGNYVVRASKSDNASGLSSADQIKIGRHIVGLEPFSTIYKTIAGDVNNSGSLSSADQIKIGRFIVGLDSNLISGAWKFYSSAATLNVTNYLITGLTRVYTNLTADSSNQDFIGVKMGDVNNSWINN